MSQYAANIAYLLRKHALDAGKLASDLGLKDLARPLPDEIPLVASRFALTTDLLLRKDIELLEERRSKDIKLVVFDVDGVLTDGGMLYTESGDEFKKFNAKDGLAIRRVKQRGIQTGIISHGYNSKLIQRRAERLHIELLEVSQVPKLQTLSLWCEKLKISYDNVCFIGDDVNDEDILKAVGFSACPADAVDEVKNMVHVVMQKKGGDGCVRELIDLYLS